jgi:chemotaxis protein MotB
MNTYADMVTLLLCFFVLLFAFSNLDVRKFEELAASLQTAFNIQPGGATSNPAPNVYEGSLLEGQGDTRQRTDSTATEKSHQVLAMIQQTVKELNLDTEIETWVDERGVVVSISEQLLFDEGSARLYPEARRILSKIGEVLELLPNDLAVEGHTDPERPLNSIYGDNWGLSSARAAMVTSYLNETIGISAKRLRAVGLSSTSPKIPNDSPANMRLNRRVDIIILSEHSVR